MLVEGLRTAFAWWSSWGGMSAKPPEIETVVSGPRATANGPRHAVALVSGGVDSAFIY